MKYLALVDTDLVFCTDDLRNTLFCFDSAKSAAQLAPLFDLGMRITVIIVKWINRQREFFYV
jgi:hypothetical protein